MLKLVDASLKIVDRILELRADVCKHDGRDLFDVHSEQAEVEDLDKSLGEKVKTKKT